MSGETRVNLFLALMLAGLVAFAAFCVHAARVNKERCVAECMVLGNKAGQCQFICYRIRD
jgi:hypothetical protein